MDFLHLLFLSDQKRFIFYLLLCTRQFELEVSCLLLAVL